MKRLLPVLAAVVAAAAPAADDGSPRLPHEGSRAWPALRETTFPDRLSAFIWRNWFCVDKARLAETVGTGPEELTAVAVEMGLPADPKVEPEWASKGYGTILRRNWHLLPYGQILTLLGSCRGTLEWRGLTNAMCTQAPEVRRWMGDAVEKVFRAAPGLGGVFVINASENLVTCVSHGDRSVYEKDPTGACRPEQFCKTCQRLSVPEILADDAKLLIDGMHRADPAAKAFVWDWGWDVFSAYGETGLVREVAARLPKANVSLLTMSVRGKPLDIDGTACAVDEYTLSQVGPSEAAEAKWRIAAANGLGRVAKAQVSSSWEMSVVPYVPVMDNVAAHAWNLMRADVDDVMLSWSCGCYPAPNLRVFDGVRKGDAGPADVLRRVRRWRTDLTRARASGRASSRRRGARRTRRPVASWASSARSRATWPRAPTRRGSCARGSAATGRR